MDRRAGWSSSRRAQSFAWACTFVVLGVTASGCSRFSASDESDGGPAGDGSAVGDGSAAGEAGSDGGAACADQDTVLLGPKDLSTALPRQNDFIAPQIRDAHSLPGRIGGEARCAWLYIVTPPPTGKVHLGVYADLQGAPRTLLAKATFTNVQGGWRSAPLDKPVPVTVGSPMWIAVGPDEDLVEVKAQLGNCTTKALSGSIPAGKDLEESFTGTNPFDSCDLLAYLGR